MNKIKQYIKILELCQTEQSFKGQSEQFSDHVKLIQEGYIGSRFSQEEPYSFSLENTFGASLNKISELIDSLI